jgi:hypothetical protein
MLLLLHVGTDLDVFNIRFHVFYKTRGATADKKDQCG